MILHAVSLHKPPICTFHLSVKYTHLPLERLVSEGTHEAHVALMWHNSSVCRIWSLQNRFKGNCASAVSCDLEIELEPAPFVTSAYHSSPWTMRTRDHDKPFTDSWPVISVSTVRFKHGSTRQNVLVNTHSDSLSSYVPGKETVWLGVACWGTTDVDLHAGWIVSKPSFVARWRAETVLVI